MSRFFDFISVESLLTGCLRRSRTHCMNFVVLNVNKHRNSHRSSSHLWALTGVKYKLLYNIYNRSFLVVLFFLRLSCILPTRKSLEQQEQEQQQQPRTQHQVCTFVCLFVVLFSRKNIQHTSSAQQRIKHLFDHFPCFSMFVLFF